MNWFLYVAESFFIGIFIGGIFFLFKNKVKCQFIKRFGGIIIILASILAILFHSEIEITRQIFSILIGSVAILFFGVLDDIKKISWKYQLIFQLILALFLVWSGFRIDHIKLFNEIVLNFNVLDFNFLGNQLYLVSAGIFIIWLVAIINAINWIDGINGLSGIISIMALLSVFFVSLRLDVNQPAVAMISLMVIGVTLAFLVFNLLFPSLIAGTSGSYFFGFILATLAVVAGMKIATLMLILILPIIDAGWVIFDRIKSGQSIFMGDYQARHLHYRLLNMGWSEKKVLLMYAIFFAVILIVNFYLPNRNFKLFFLCLEISLINSFMFYVYKNKLRKKDV